MVSLKQVGTLAMAALGIATTQSHACPASRSAEPINDQASERHPLVAGWTNPAGLALAGTAGAAGVARLAKRGRVGFAAKSAPKVGTTAAFDYPGGEEW